ncbi:hypothetical protein MJ579_29195 [Klebsiella pneumoniae]|nr:hypothetical protein MJ579_29195 [Klebsiella pneumoniae]
MKLTKLTDHLKLATDSQASNQSHMSEPRLWRSDREYYKMVDQFHELLQRPSAV